MSESAERSRERKEHIPSAETVYANARDQLELRLAFAEAIANKKGISYGDALRDYTDIFIRAFGVWPGQSQEADEKWSTFAKEVEARQSQEEKSRYILEAFAKQIERARETLPEMPYWPFRYDYHESTRTVEMHFGTMSPVAEQAPDEPGVLSKERLEEQRAKLAAMFREIKERHPDAVAVRGSSWLYNREAYRRFFPESYTHTHTLRKGGYGGGGRWGQFRNKDGGVKMESKEAFLRNIENLDPDNIDAAFPLQPWEVSAPISDFYREYGIE